MEKEKIVFKGSHPDSLYRVSSGSVEDGKISRALRLLRWPVALIAVCVALAVFVYFLMPDNFDMEAVNGTYWEPVGVTSQFQNVETKPEPVQKPHPVPKLVEPHANKTKPPEQNNTQSPARPLGSKPVEIDFYNAEVDKEYIINSKSKLPVPPVFPSHIAPEVQYGNEETDKEKLRSAKFLEATNTLPEDSTLKPHITHKPERPLEIVLEDINVTTSSNTETITRAETVNDFTNHEEKETTKRIVLPTTKVGSPLVYKEYPQIQRGNPRNDRQSYAIEPQIPEEIQDFYSHPVNVNATFTSGHSKLFGISIEEAGKMRSTTTQSSLYNTRVSPTLPTWRDGDDTTTKKYPVTTNSEVPQCRSPRLAMCRGVLPYDLAAAPISILGNPVTSLLPQLQYLVASNCSDRARHFACAMLEPECNPPPLEPKMPCFNLCRAVSDSCDGQMPRELLEMFSCENYNYGYTSCVPAKAPCFAREISCGDGTCVPRDWICDGTTDCPSGVDEKSCSQCDQTEHQCRSGTCIQKRWLCDGYSDCPDGDDEDEAVCEKRELGEEPSGSAPALSVRRPAHATLDPDTSKELLMTSDTNNGLKRNFTRRPSLSRLTPYSHPAATSNRKPGHARASQQKHQKFANPSAASDETNIENLFEDFDKKEKDNGNKIVELKTPMGNFVNIPSPDEVLDIKEPAAKAPTRLDKSINNLERVIDGAAMLKKAAAQQEEEAETSASPESNNTSVEKAEPPPKQPATGNLKTGPVSVNMHASPCDSGELRCVDGRCITLAQLCDGTIDCSDHADEDNCYT